MVDVPTRYEALLQAIDALGSQAELARICEITPQAVSKMVQSSKQLPAEYVLRVEAATGVHRHYLRPDIYPLELPAVTMPPRFLGVDRGNTRVSFNTRSELKQAAAR